MSNTDPSSQRVPSLDGIRAVAIIFVMLSHGLDSVRRDAPRLFPYFQFLSTGPFGVLIFFLISGFLITRILMREQERRGRIDLINFYLRRSMRIFPAFYVYLLTIAILFFCGWVQIARSDWLSAGLYVWNYKFIWNPSEDAGNAVFGHFWTLSIEEQFYLFWPQVMILLGARKARVFACAVLVMMPVSRTVTALVFPESRSHLFYMTHTNCDNLMYGCLAALLWDEARFQKWLKRLYQWHVPVIALVYVLLISPWLLRPLGGYYLYTVGLTLEGALNLLIVLWCIGHPQSAVGRVLNHPAMICIGMLSYSLYLWQQFFLFYPIPGWPGLFPYNYICVCVAAVLSYWIVERTFLRLRERNSRAVVPSLTQ